MPAKGGLVPRFPPPGSATGCYLSRLLPQHSAPFTAQIWQAESVINFSHVAIDPIFVEITVLFQRKLTVVAYKPLQYLLECQTCSYFSRNTCQTFNSSQRLATRTFPDSTTFPLSAGALKKSMQYTVRKLRRVKRTWPWMTKIGAGTRLIKVENNVLATLLSA